MHGNDRIMIMKKEMFSKVFFMLLNVFKIMPKCHQIFQLKLCTMAHNFQLSVGYKIFK